MQAPVRIRPSEWTETTTADNAAATVTKAAVTNQSHYITHISGTFGAASTKLMTLKDGSTVKGNYHVVNSLSIEFASPIKIDGAAELSLAASGTASVLGAVTMAGYTL